MSHDTGENYHMSLHNGFEPLNVHISAEIMFFCSEYKFTEREEDIFILLLNSIISNEALSHRLKVSPNTIKNHLTSIFEKTNSGGRAELLALFSAHLLKIYNKRMPFFKKPKVLIVDDEREICEYLKEDLTYRGLKVYTAQNAKEVLEMIRSLDLDAILLDIEMPEMTGIKLLEEVRKVYYYVPTVFFITAYSKYEVDEMTHLGAADIFYKPLDIDVLFAAIVEHFIDSPNEKSRILRVDFKTPIIKIGQDIELTMKNIGFGGAFLSFDHTTVKKDLKLQISDRVDFSFKLVDHETSIKAQGEVAWLRTKNRPGLEPGFGVRFVYLSDRGRDLIHRFVRKNRIVSYIPKN